MTSARLAFGLLCAAAALCSASGCGSSVGPIVLRDVAPLPVTAIQPPPPIDVPACRDGDLVVPNDGVAVDLVCEDGHRDCRGELPVALRNCAAEPVRVSRLSFMNDRDATTLIIEFDPLPIVRSGESWSHRVGMSFARDFTVEIALFDGDAVEHSVTMRAAVRNPNREQAMARCRECDGDWGRHGLLGLEGCLCRARDAGRECRDGRDCEGTCLYERSERVQEASESCRDGYCDVTLEMFVLVGRCSEFVTTFGCHHYLPDGISDEGPFMARYPAPYRCCD